MVCVFPVGAWFCIKELNDERVFIVLYAVFASYFAGVMIRLMLTLTPCVCVLGERKTGMYSIDDGLSFQRPLHSRKRWTTMRTTNHRA